MDGFWEFTMVDRFAIKPRQDGALGDCNEGSLLDGQGHDGSAYGG